MLSRAIVGMERMRRRFSGWANIGCCSLWRDSLLRELWEGVCGLRGICGWLDRVNRRGEVWLFGGGLVGRTDMNCWIGLHDCARYPPFDGLMRCYAMVMAVYAL